MWKKGKQWLCGAALFFMVVSSPGMLVLADEVNSGDATEVTAGEEAPPLPEGSTENEVEGATEEGGTSSTEAATQQEENTPNTAENVGGGKKERPKRSWVLTQPTAIKDIFPDARLANVIRVKLNKASVNDVVTQAQLNGITILNAKNDGIATKITNLSGIEYLGGLKDLNISRNQISDISPLSYCNKLNIIIADDNQISDISPLAEIPQIYRLQAVKNQISDISPLAAGQTYLSDVDLSDNQISDISPLAGIPKLHKLYADKNQISDISSMSRMGYLTEVSLNNNQISDISPLINDTNGVTKLYLNNNQISDISVLSGKTKYRTVEISGNQISDISPLAALINSTPTSTGWGIKATNQKITLPTKKWSNLINTPNIVRDETDLEAPSVISNSGQYEDSTVKWTGLLNVNQEVTYSWTDNRNIPSTGVDVGYRVLDFSGIVAVGIDSVKVKILVDTDGNSQTTGDQTVFAEEADANWNSLEDMYNYVKEQLNGTDYGLLNVETDSNDDYVILVSKVGSLKKEDADGTALGTDVPYTPTYTVTGVGDDAELSVSYDEILIAPPTGYVYIHEKGTTQEVRYTEETLFDIPLTDTNGNGIPQWKEDYTVGQYQRAGALKPTTPGGSQVPGSTISIPDDAITGEIITVPDTIIGSDGREYGVDPSVDTDSNTPGVQITLTEDEQDIPYFDVLLSESESTSASLSESESSSLSESESISQSTSESISLSESESVSQSESESSSLSESESSSLSESESISQSTSESISLSESESVSQSESESS
ncbi:leucine-rich repeat domain-containing protein, partial [Listeria monocytogenes]|nr:leucine-rich repeat domain-containing protein [Listeria monocytogenes]